MKPSSNSRHRSGFTLVETVFAIGVLAVLLTGFILVFTPAAEGIKKSINIQLADRLASAVEQELVTLRGTQQASDYKTGFNKSYDFIQKSNTSAPATALMVYQYRGSATTLRTDDNDSTPVPMPVVTGKQPGKDYVVVSMVRRKNDPKFNEDLAAVEGSVFVVKCTQLVFGNLPPPSTGTGLISGAAGMIQDPKAPAGNISNPDLYPEAVVTFSADFYMMPAKSAGYFAASGPFDSKFPNLKNPVFTRNLAVRR